MGTGRVSLRRLRMGDGFVKFGEAYAWLPSLIVPLTAFPVLGIGLRQYYHPETTPNPPELWQLGLIAGVLLLGTVVLVLAFGCSLRIDAGGVTEKFLFRTRHLSWRQIRDYGFSYAGFGRARLCFADERLLSNPNGRRHRGGRCCGILLRRSELKRSGEILNICREYTRVRPYLCTEDGKLTGKLKDR